MSVEDIPRATDLLANERTFLAYLRTALTFVAFGFVVARFALFERELALLTHSNPPSHGVSVLFGTLVALFGSALAAYGGLRYSAAARALREGRSAGLSTIAATVMCTIATVIGAAVAIDLVALR
jgi:putative membrane protein